MFEVTRAQFVSKASSAGVVHVMLGYKPDFILGIFDHGGTNPLLRFWFNNDSVSGWAAALDLLLTGSTGVVTRDTTGITVYDGGDVIATTETADTDGKHVNINGTFSTAGDITSEGVSVPADHQVASGANVLLCFRVE